mmetsp:Transcript_27993/g.89206  ORF Transcript_27993/g.89206 Transcript_27993/m.89206 type:complete len:341 (-) Transcript_27993:1149-2171(-)
MAAADSVVFIRATGPTGPTGPSLVVINEHHAHAHLDARDLLRDALLHLPGDVLKVAEPELEVFLLLCVRNAEAHADNGLAVLEGHLYVAKADLGIRERRRDGRLGFALQALLVHEGAGPLIAAAFGSVAALRLQVHEHLRHTRELGLDADLDLLHDGSSLRRGHAAGRRHGEIHVRLRAHAPRAHIFKSQAKLGALGEEGVGAERALHLAHELGVGRIRELLERVAADLHAGERHHAGNDDAGPRVQGRVADARADDAHKRDDAAQRIAAVVPGVGDEHGAAQSLAGVHRDAVHELLQADARRGHGDGEHARVENMVAVVVTNVRSSLRRARSPELRDAH